MRALLLLVPMLALAQNSVKSPDGAIEISFTAEGGPLAYTVNFHGRPLLLKSTMALEVQDQAPLGPAVRIATARAGKVDETYPMPHGKSNPVWNRANTLSVDVEETAGARRKFTVEARAYDDAVAFRYAIPSQNSLTTLRLAGERTEFQLAKDATTYPLILRNFRT
jgi:alpha-glucosidase